MAVALVGSAALVGVTVFVAGQGMGGSGDWAGVLSLSLAGLIALLSLVAWMARRARPERGDDGTLADRLRDAVRIQWTAEAGARRLGQPRPLRLTWHSTSRPVTVTPASTALRGSLVATDGDALSSAGGLVAAFRAGGRRQLVVLGAPGAGKSTLAVLFTIAAIDSGPVPVLLSVAGWDPADLIEDWVARRISEDYPAVTGVGRSAAAAVRRLIDDRTILPVLDGLDEMPLDLLGAALENLDRAAGSGLPMVVTCRYAEFEEAVAQAGALSNAAVVEIDPVRVADAEAYLTERELPGSTRWRPVLDDLRGDPAGPVASVLSTPLMIAVARVVYQRPGTDPGHLRGFPTVAALERHLLDRFLTTVYPRTDAERWERRWLTFLARHLRDTARDPNLRWWRLAGAVRDGALHAVITIALTIGGAILGLLSVPEPVGATVGAVAGLFTGVLCSRHIIRMTRVGAPSSVVRAARNAMVDVAFATATTAAVFSAIVLTLLAVLGVVDAAGAVELNTKLVVLAQDTWARSGTAALVAVYGLVFAAVLAGLGAGRGGEPRRGTPSVRRLLPSLVVGFAVGLALALLALPVLGPFDSVLLLVTVGVPVGLGRWFTGPPAGEAAASPGLMLRGDRTALLLTVTVVVVGTATALQIMLRVTPSFLYVPVMPVAATFGVLAAFGTGAAWVSYTLARLWLAARGDLPWRPMRFLRSAYTAGVLRQAGPAYQFRHDRLRIYLAGDAAPVPPRRWTRVSAYGRFVAVGTAAVLVATSLALPEAYEADLPGADSDIFYLAYGSDGTLASASTDGTVTVWDAAARRVRRTVRVPDADGDFGVALSPDGSTLAAQTAEHLNFWSTATGDRRVITVPDVGHGFVWSLAFSPDGSVLALADEVMVRLVTVADGRVRGTVSAPDVSDLQFASGGAVLATGRWDGLTLWDTATGTHIRQLSAMGIVDLDVTADGSGVVVVETDLVDSWWLRSWDIATGRQRWSVEAGEPEPTRIDVSAYGSTLITDGVDGRVWRWDVDTGRPRTTWWTDTFDLAAVAVSPDGSRFATTSYADRTRQWRVDRWARDA
jgi:hypothetical protein